MRKLIRKITKFLYFDISYQSIHANGIYDPFPPKEKKRNKRKKKTKENPTCLVQYSEKPEIENATEFFRWTRRGGGRSLAALRKYRKMIIARHATSSNKTARSHSSLEASWSGIQMYDVSLLLTQTSAGHFYRCPYGNAHAAGTAEGNGRTLAKTHTGGDRSTTELSPTKTYKHVKDQQINKF